MSVSDAWDETRQIIRKESRLMAAVALALLFLPGVIVSVVNPTLSPTDFNIKDASTWLLFVGALIGLIGQLAIIRLTLTPRTSVSEAIVHGAQRLPFYFAATLLWVAPLVIGFFLIAGPMVDDPETASGGALLAGCVLLVALLYLMVRMLLASAVASAERVGPIEILRRGWAISRGNWWRLFGFIVLFGIAAGVFLLAVAAIGGLLARMLFGEIEPMSLSALVNAAFAEFASAVITVVLSVMIARLYAQVARPAVSVPSSGG
jgi:hypothetical protein